MHRQRALLPMSDIELPPPEGEQPESQSTPYNSLKPPRSNEKDLTPYNSLAPLNHTSGSEQKQATPYNSIIPSSALNDRISDDISSSRRSSTTNSRRARKTKNTCCKHGMGCRIGRATQPREAKEAPVEIPAPEAETAQYENITPSLPLDPPNTSNNDPTPRPSLKKERKSRSSKQRPAVVSTINNDKQEKIRALFDEESAAGKRYRGMLTWKEAEDRPIGRADFILYHRAADDGSERPHPRLFICYMTNTGSFRHYRVRSNIIGDTTMYFVDCGDPQAPRFISIDALVRYYSTFATLRQRGPTELTTADIFPWWEN